MEGSSGAAHVRLGIFRKKEGEGGRARRPSSSWKDVAAVVDLMRRACPDAKARHQVCALPDSNDAVDFPVAPANAEQIFAGTGESGQGGGLRCRREWQETARDVVLLPEATDPD